MVLYITREHIDTLYQVFYCEVEIEVCVMVSLAILNASSATKTTPKTRARIYQSLVLEFADRAVHNVKESTNFAH